MGELIAVLNKKGEDATETAATMLKALKPNRAEAFGIASPSNIRIEKTTEAFEGLDLHSHIVIGQVFTPNLNVDKPQPIRLDGASLVFQGRIYPSTDEPCDAESVAQKLQRLNQKALETFIKKAEGDFALAIAENDKFIAARDILGMRPLYYGENSKVTAIASARKALWRIGIQKTASFPPGHLAVADENDFRFKCAKAVIYLEPMDTTLQRGAKKLQRLLELSTEKRVGGLREVAVAFSGGLDSSLVAFLAKNSGVDTHLIHVSLENQPETTHAINAAKELKLPIHICLHREEDVAQALPRVLELIEEPDPVKASIGVPLYWTAEKAVKMGLRVILVGQGADEMFGGYRRYADDYQEHGGEKVRETMYEDVISLHETNLERDSKICSFHGLELRLPFVTYQIAQFAAGLPTELKLDSSDKNARKLVLRKVAENLGLPQFIAKKPKKALQYTTGVNQAIERLAKKRGLSSREYVQKTFDTIFKTAVIKK